MRNLPVKTKILIATALVAVGVAGRLLPHAWNFAPIAAIGLFAGARLGVAFGFLLPVAAMAISDASIGFYDWHINATVYAAMALSGAIGLFLRNKRNPIAIAAGSAAASTLFFLITNAAVWFFGTMYPPTFSGLMMSLVAGLPFFRNAALGDLWYSAAFFGAWELAILAYDNRARIKQSTLLALAKIR
ncbi:MAG TPA: DUF6580 family putative transport protein [Candidatus Paceibacterota bacterium]|nr:DUF6580 family putative transport protein [Candidatus Paceibacterota bacterium]